MTRRGRRTAIVLGLVALAVAPAAARAQELPGAAAPVIEVPPLSVSPRGAFLRAIALPGWGHAAIGSHGRGGFYFVAESAAAFTLVRTRVRLGDVRRRIEFRETFLRSELTLEGVTDPSEVDARLDGDAPLAELRRLEDSRSAQQEDMVALGIFLILLSGADAYVSAHLSRFPEPLELEAQPVADGRIEIGLRLRIHE